VSPNPRDYQVEKGKTLYIEEACDILVAIGGGSVIDCAKGIGVIVENDGSIRDYEGVDEIALPIPPLICIPTTSGSAADVSQFAIISHTDKAYKMVLASKMLVPDLALIDPQVTLTCDFDLTIDTALDALAHAVEAYVSNASSFATDLHALKAIEVLVDHLPDLAKDLNNIEARAYVMTGCLHAGIAFSNASLGLIHALAHALGGRFELIHGEMNALLLEHVSTFNEPAVKDRFKNIKAMIDKDNKTETIGQAINNFVSNIRPNKHLKELYQGQMDFEALSDFVLKDPCIVTNPRNVTKEDVVTLYEKIF
jgi:alcohol dehydrogenase class IV